MHSCRQNSQRKSKTACSGRRVRKRAAYFGPVGLEHGARRRTTTGSFVASRQSLVSSVLSAAFAALAGARSETTSGSVNQCMRCTRGRSRTRVCTRSSRRTEAWRGGESFEVANRVRGTERGYIALLGAGCKTRRRLAAWRRRRYVSGTRQVTRRTALVRLLRAIE